MENKYANALKEELVKHKAGKENEVIVACENLIEANEKMLLESEKLRKYNDEITQSAENVATTALKLTSILKDIHAVLGSKKDLFKDDQDIEGILTILSRFVLNAGVEVK